MLLAVLLSFAPFGTTAPATPTGPDIVVRAERAGAALAKCLAAGCPAADDIRISIAQAELQFAQGSYRDARATLNQSIERTKREAARYPHMVAALYEASATVNLHYGDMEAFRRATTQRASILRANLKADDPALTLLPIELGDARAQANDWVGADQQYLSAARNYAANGQPWLAAMASLRAAAMAISQDRLSLAEERIRAVGKAPAASDPAIVQVSAMLKARIAAAQGRDGGVEALLATLRDDPTAPPQLISGDKYQEEPSAIAANSAGRFGEVNRAQLRSGDTVGIRWVDIGFLVTPDGTVSDVEVLRGNRSKEWAKPYLEQVASRRYVPPTVPAGSPGRYRIERFTLRATRQVPIGSLVAQPVGTSELRVLDLTKVGDKPPA
jgi:hypothetical protein